MGTFNIGWLILLFLFLATLFIFWRVDIDKSPNSRRFGSGVLMGLLIPIAYLYGWIDEAAVPLHMGQIILVSLPIFGGILLFLIALIPSLQDGTFEYISWALCSNFLILMLFPQASIRVQLIAVLVLMTLTYSVQHLEGQPFSHKHDSNLSVKAGMRVASWLTGIKQVEDWPEEESDSGTKHPSDSDNDPDGT